MEEEPKDYDLHEIDDYQEVEDAPPLIIFAAVIAILIIVIAIIAGIAASVNAIIEHFGVWG